MRKEGSAGGHKIHGLPIYFQEGKLSAKFARDTPSNFLSIFNLSYDIYFAERKGWACLPIISLCFQLPEQFFGKHIRSQMQNSLVQ
jgi:hypothetical protein